MLDSVCGARTRLSLSKSLAQRVLILGQNYRMDKSSMKLHFSRMKIVFDVNGQYGSPSDQRKPASRCPRISRYFDRWAVFPFSFRSASCRIWTAYCLLAGCGTSPLYLTTRSPDVPSDT